MRLEQWPKLLSEYIKEKRNEPFSWGDNDCILFAVKGYEKLTGIDHYSQYLGYSDRESAYNIIMDNGGFQELICKHFGAGHKDYIKAKRGDLVVMKIPEFTCGLVDDSGQYVACVSEKGLIRLPLRKAWRIWSY